MELKDRLNKIERKIYKIQHNCVEPDSSISCPYCGHELLHWDTYGRFYGSASGEVGKKDGDIYRCCNEYCEYFNSTFYTCGDSDELQEGFPC